MNLAFLDVGAWDYDAATPFERPLGGSQSAFCYLAGALAARGHDVTLYTGATQKKTFQGVQNRSNKDITSGTFAGCDAVIVSNGPADVAIRFRPYIPARCPIVMWTQHDPNQSAMALLAHREVRDAWDFIVCVSQCHQDAMIRKFGLDPNRVAIRRNAIGPAFINLFPDAATFAGQKSPTPLLAYTSTPFRGLDVLVSIFGQVQQRIPGARLEIYSSLKVYQMEDRPEDLRLYERCRSIPGVQYLGSQPQPTLAQMLKPAWVLAYPNTYPETSCIAVMEAMAAGMLVITSDLGALPETTSGMGILTPGSRDVGDLPRFAREFTDRLIAAIEEIGRDPQQFWNARWEQVRTMTTQCTWPIRAAEWEQLLRDIGQQRKLTN